MAAPRKLTSARHARIVDLVRNGTAAFRAAQATGISERSWWRWVAQVRELAEAQHTDPEDLDPEEVDPDVRPLVTLWQDVQRAAAECEAAQLLRIQKAANDGTWQAAAWILERLWPDRYVKRIDHRVDATAPPDPAAIVKSAKDNVVRLDRSRRTG